MLSGKRYYKVSFIAALMDLDKPWHSYIMVYAKDPKQAWQRVEAWFNRRPENVLSLYNMGVEDVKSLEENLVDILKWTNYNLYLKAWDPAHDDAESTLRNLKKLNLREWQMLMDLGNEVPKRSLTTGEFYPQIPQTD